ncbi:MAG: hypothetical protein ACI8RA_000276, partial [Chlamydiales bacterium]
REHRERLNFHPANTILQQLYIEVYPEFLKAAPETVERTYGDGAYDTEGCYEASDQHGSALIVPPQRNAIFHQNAPLHMQARNDAYL